MSSSWWELFRDRSFWPPLLLRAAALIRGFFLVAALISMLIVCGPLLSSALPDFAAAYKTSVFALGFAMLLLPLLEPGSIAASVVGLVTYCVSVLLVWIVLARIHRALRALSLFTFGIGWAACTAGLLVGTFSGALVLSFVPTTPRLLSAVVLVCVCLLFLRTCSCLPKAPWGVYLAAAISSAGLFTIGVGS